MKLPYFQLLTASMFIGILFICACEGPEGPVGPEGVVGLSDTTYISTYDTTYIFTSDTTYVIDTVFVLHVDGREIIWLYPDSASAVPGSYYPLNPGGEYHYFDISYSDFLARRASTIWVMPQETVAGWDSSYQWQTIDYRGRQNWMPVTPSNESHQYYGKLGLYNGYEIGWQYAYFYWDAE